MKYDETRNLANFTSDDVRYKKKKSVQHILIKNYNDEIVID